MTDLFTHIADFTYEDGIVSFGLVSGSQDAEARRVAMRLGTFEQISNFFVSEIPKVAEYHKKWLAEESQRLVEVGTPTSKPKRSDELGRKLGSVD